MADILDKLNQFSARLNKNFIEEQGHQEKRFKMAVQFAIKDMRNQIIRIIGGLVEDDGKIENSQRNIDQIIARKVYLDKVVNKLIKDGAKTFTEGAIEIERLTRDEFKQWQRDLRTAGVDSESAVFNLPALKEAARGSVELWGDSMGTLSDTVQTGLIRMVLGGATKEQLINEYAKEVPSIVKRNPDGTIRWQMSAINRSMFTFRTETTRLQAKVMDGMARQAFGNDYYVQNFNPLDERTDKLQCYPATEAGPMLISELEARFGLPGRHVNCRCSIGAVPSFLVRK